MTHLNAEGFRVLGVPRVGSQMHLTPNLAEQVPLPNSRQSSSLLQTSVWREPPLRICATSRKTFKEAEPDIKSGIHPTAPSEKYLPVVETFHSVQGEGAWVGTNAFFIRLGGCDVGCPWCDTKHSWNALRHPQQNIVELVRQARAANPAIIVITGGEPLMHNLDDLTSQLHNLELRVHLETSGAHPFSGTFDWVTFSPKRFKPSHKSLYPHIHELKVVVADSSDLEWAESQVANVPSSAVKYLQPEWNTPDSHNLIFEYVLRHPEWRISLQTHKFLKIR